MTKSIQYGMYPLRFDAPKLLNPRGISSDYNLGGYYYESKHQEDHHSV